MKFIDYFVYVPKKIITSFENSNIPLSAIFFTFFSAIILRNFFESFSQASVNYFDLNAKTLILNWIHFFLSYLSGAISLILLLYFALRENILKITRVVLPCFFILIFPPIIDLIATGGKGSDIFYLGALSIHNTHELFFYFKNYSGITLGMRIEIALALYAIFCYLLIKRSKIMISLLYTVLAYELIFMYCAAPIMVQSLMHLLNVPYHHSSLNMIRFYTILITITGSVFWIIAQPKTAISIFKDLRYLRLLHYFLMMTLGVLVALINTPLSIHEIIFDKNPDWMINYILCLFSIVFAGLFSIITNNIADIEIDKISNPTRPLIQDTIRINDYMMIGKYALVCSLIFALIAGFKPFLIMLTIIASYYLYSMPPIRIKRIPLISKMVIALNSLMMVILGFILITQNLLGFPMILFPIYLIGITLSANFIDIKDYEGDKLCGIVTLPGLLGLKTAKIIISIGFLLTYASFYLLVTKPIWLLFLLGASLLQIILIHQKKYRESPVFLVYLLSLVVFITSLFLGKIMQ